MDYFKYDFDKEIQDVIEEVSSTYKYNDDLKNVLYKIAKVINKNKSFEERQAFYDILKTTPIVVLPHDTKLTHEELNSKMLGDINKHIKDKDNFDKGEYGRQGIAGGGAFVSAPIFDENLNITEVKRYIYVDGFDTKGKLTSTEQKFFDIFKTGINVPHLIHELGHAIVSEKNSYSVEDVNGEKIVSQRLGACVSKYKIKEIGNGLYEEEQISMDGLFIEEGANSVFEEDTVAEYCEIPLEEAKKLYGTVLPASLYQPRISRTVRSLEEKGFKDDFRKWRTTGDKEALERINETFSKANFYEKRDKLFVRNERDSGNVDKELIPARNHIFNNPESQEQAEILSRMEKDFFPETENMTPMEMFNNILLQYYDASVNKYHFSIERYKKILDVVEVEGDGFIKQAQAIKADEKQKSEQEKNEK